MPAEASRFQTREAGSRLAQTQGLDHLLRIVTIVCCPNEGDYCRENALRVQRVHARQSWSLEFVWCSPRRTLLTNQQPCLIISEWCTAIVLLAFRYYRFLLASRNRNIDQRAASSPLPDPGKASAERGGRTRRKGRRPTTSVYLHRESHHLALYFLSFLGKVRTRTTLTRTTVPQWRRASAGLRAVFATEPPSLYALRHERILN